MNKRKERTEERNFDHENEAFIALLISSLCPVRLSNLDNHLGMHVKFDKFKSNEKRDFCRLYL